MVKLAPWTTSSTLSAQLQTIDLREHVEYTAVSYTWGSQPFDKTIRINDQGDVSITQSCYDALQYLRDSGKLFVWIDQLSIDQHNLTERAQQVQLMSSIYTEAALVVAWLGPIGQRNHRALDAVLEDVKDIDAAETLRSYVYISMNRMEARGAADFNFWFDPDTQEVANDQVVWDFLFDFLTVRYWRRRFVLQETALQKNVNLVYGDRIFGWDHWNAQ
jgi:hypothetical protein